MNCIYLFTNYWPSIAMRASLFFAFLIALITSALRRWGWGKHICWDSVSFSAFLKMEWGEQFLFKGVGGGMRRRLSLKAGIALEVITTFG